MGILKGMKRFLWLVLPFVISISCTPATETAVSPQPSPETAVLPTVPPPVITEELPQMAEATAVPNTIEPTEAPAEAIAAPPEPTAAVVVEVGVTSGRTDEGAFFLGDPNAPITHIDYSDFL